MDHFEMVDKLREKADVTYEEAKAALEAADWDMLDAMVYLERMGKLGAEPLAFSTKVEQEEKQHHKHHHDHASGWNRFLTGLGRLFQQSLVNTFDVGRSGEMMFSIPVLALVLMLFCLPYILIPLLIIGLFFGYNYSFGGPNLNRDELNRAMDKASEAAEHIKREVARESGEQKDEE